MRGRGLRRLAAGTFGAALCLVPGPALAHGSADAPSRGLAGLLDWTFDPLTVLVLAGTAALYLEGVRRVRRNRPRSPWPGSRTGAFMAGLVVLAVALLSPIGTFDDELFSLHMTQHLLLTMVAAPLLLFGGPVLLVLRAVGRRGHRRVLAVVRSGPVTVITNPAFAWLAFAGAMWGAHFSGLYNYALGHEWAHVLEHVLFLGTAMLFWQPVVGLDPSHWRMSHGVRLVYVLLQMPQNTFLSLALYSATSPLYPFYVQQGRTWGPSVVDDQQLGGAIMWIAGDLILLTCSILVLWAWMRHDDRVTTPRLDRQVAEQRQLAAYNEMFAERARAGERHWGG